MQNKCDVCNEWHGSCVSITDDIMGRAEHYICPNCLMWSEDTIAKLARAHVRPVKAKKAKKGVKNGNKQK